MRAALRAHCIISSYALARAPGSALIPHRISIFSKSSANALRPARHCYNQACLECRQRKIRKGVWLGTPNFPQKLRVQKVKKRLFQMASGKSSYTTSFEDVRRCQLHLAGSGVDAAPLNHFRARGGNVGCGQRFRPCLAVSTVAACAVAVLSLLPPTT
jgi:hypothetical protein